MRLANGKVRPDIVEAMKEQTAYDKRMEARDTERPDRILRSLGYIPCWFISDYVSDIREELADERKLRKLDK